MSVYKNIRLALISFVLGLLLFSFVIPRYQEIIPYDGVIVDPSLTSSLGPNKGYKIAVSFRNTACEFADLRAYVMYDGSSVMQEYPWREVAKIDGERYDKAKGWQILNIVVSTPQSATRDNGAVIILITDHNCAIKDRERYVVIDKALPGTLSRDPEKITVTKILARVEI